MGKIAYAGASALERSVLNPLSPGPRRPYRKLAVNLEVVERYKDRLPKPYYAILMASVGSEYRSLMDQLGIKALGTVKSRLNRAREALDKLIEADRAAVEAPTCP